MRFNQPIFNKLQSSYADVEFELDVFRQAEHHKDSLVIFAGGDGASIMRME
jgi:hypothetical protein